MKSKICVTITLLLCLATAVNAQYNYRHLDDEDEYSSYLKIGTQIPFQHSILYDHRITPSFSINGGIGLIAAPYPDLIFSGIENKGLISAQEREVIDRSYESGITYHLGANVHFSRNYVRLFGQLAHLNGDVAIADVINLYLGTNIPDLSKIPFVGNFLRSVNIKSNVPMAGLLYGRRFPVGPRSEVHAEAAISKTLGHSTRYKTGTFIDDIGIVNSIAYNEIDKDLDHYFRRYGWYPSLNVYYVFKF